MLSYCHPTRRPVVWCCAIVAIAMLLGTSIATGATLAEQRRELRAAATAIRSAARLANAQRGEDAAETFIEAQTKLQAIASGLDPKLRKSFERTIEDLAQAHAELTKAGIQLPPLAKIEATEEKGAPGLADSPPPPGSQISFVKEVAPLLLSKCGSCHVDQSRGQFSMATYNSLMRGTRDASVIEVGSGAESRLIDVIVSGSMPPNGEVSPAETQRLLRWINQGAKFDGDNPDTPLRDLKGGDPSPPGAPQTPPAMPKIAVPKPKGNETVSFATDVAPILTASCNTCHGATGPSAMFSVADFERLWRGGNKGGAIVPGKPEASLLVQKLKGTAAEGGQMPLNRPPLSADKIATIETWIREGASFDGPSLQDSLARVTAVVRSSRATSEELDATRLAEAQRQWRLALPDERTAHVTTPQFLILGNLPEQQLERLGATAETETKRVADWFRKPAEELNKSRLTLFAFGHRIDYSEFAVMVERRQIAPDAQSHARFDLVHPYLAVVASSSDSDDNHNARVLSQAVASLWVANQGKGSLPEWFVDGSGRAIAARLWSKDPEVKRWEEEVAAAAKGLTQPDDFMTGKAPPATTQAASYGFVDAILQKPGNFHKLVELVGQGQSFEAATQSVFKQPPKKLAELWVAAQRRR